jgi:hypothetical protein
MEEIHRWKIRDSTDSPGLGTGIQSLVSADDDGRWQIDDGDEETTMEIGALALLIYIS